MPWDQARGQNLIHSQKIVILCIISFLEVNILHQRYLQGFDFIPQHRTPGSMPGSKSRTYPIDNTFVLKFSGSPYFDNHFSENYDTYTIDTL